MKSYRSITVISKKDEEILRLNQRILEDSPDLIAVVGTDFSYHYVNPAYCVVHGLAPEDFVGRGIGDFVGDDIFEQVVRPNMEKCLRGEDTRYEEWFDFPKTGVMYMDVRYLPLSGSGKNIERIVIILRDITHMKKAEEARVVREKLQTIVELAGTYNHEINNPLCSLSGYIELLKRGEEDSKKIDYLEKAAGDISRISKVTKKLAEATSVDFVNYPDGSRIVRVETENDDGAETDTANAALDGVTAE